MQKLSYRDRIIILIVLIIMILVIGFMLLIKPKFKDISAAEDSLNNAQSQWNEIENKINQVDTIKERVQKKYNESVELGNLFVDLKRAYTLEKFIQESRYVGNVELSGIFQPPIKQEQLSDGLLLHEKKYAGSLTVYETLQELLDESDAVYVVTSPDKRAWYSQKALEQKKHVLCESPVALEKEGALFLTRLAKEKGCVFLEAIKTAYFMAFNRLVLMAKSGEVGNIKAVEATCTQMTPPPVGYQKGGFGSMAVWGPFGLLSVFSILGTDYKKCDMVTYQTKNDQDLFSKINFLYANAAASVKTGIGVKSEGELIITGTKGYIYVPSPWWKTDYFEIRYEDSTQNKRYFYQLDGEGIRYELVAFVKAINSKKDLSNIRQSGSETVCEVVEDFYGRKEMMLL